LLQEELCPRPPQRRAADRRRKAKQLERRSRPRIAEPIATGSATNLPGAHLRFFFFFNGAQKAVVDEL